MTAASETMRTNGPRETFVSVSLGPADTELREYERQFSALDARTAELTQRYPDQFVAITTDGTVVATDTMAEMIDALDKKGIDSRTAAVKFMSAKPYRMIL